MCTEREAEKPSRRLVFRKKGNRCVIYPENAVLVATSIEKRLHSRCVQTNVVCDFIIQINETTFHLHKLPMVSRSGYINRLVFQRTSTGETASSIRIDNVPGGYKIFELVVKFCYGMKVELTAPNIAPLYCAANLLEMSDDFEQGNLIEKTEHFLSFVIFSSWKDTIRILRSCETITSWARELGILKRCAESIAWKASIDSHAIKCGGIEIHCLELLENEYNSNPENLHDGWWFKDLLLLRIDHFTEVILSCKRKGIRSELVGSCIALWTAKWLSRISLQFDNLSHKNLTVRLYRITIRSLIALLPEDDNSVSYNFLLHLFKLGQVVKLDSKVLMKLERRLAVMLVNCDPYELLIKNYRHGDTSYDVGIVCKVAEAYVSLHSVKPLTLQVVGRLIDEYLTLVARDDNLPPKVFQSLIEALPKSCRTCDNHLYRAIDMYLKAHPSLTEEERNGLCRAIEYNKLSQEARSHALRNDRLPLNIITRFILLEQVKVTSSMTTAGSDYYRTKSQTIMKVTKNMGRKIVNSLKDLKSMKLEVEAMKEKLSNLQTCSAMLHSRAKQCAKV
ncbi:hypothetical protein ACET3Z_030969 [Daucus carota]